MLRTSSTNSTPQRHRKGFRSTKCNVRVVMSRRRDVLEKGATKKTKTIARPPYDRFRECAHLRRPDTISDQLTGCDDLDRSKRSWSDRSISLYKHERSTETWIPRGEAASLSSYDASVGMGARLDAATTGNAAHTFESTSERFLDVAKTYPESRGFRSYLKLSSSSSKEIGPGTYEPPPSFAKEPLEWLSEKPSSVFCSRSRRRDENTMDMRSFGRAHESWQDRRFPNGSFAKAKRDAPDETDTPGPGQYDISTPVPDVSVDITTSEVDQDETNVDTGSDLSTKKSLPDVVTPRGRMYLESIWKEMGGLCNNK